MPAILPRPEITTGRGSIGLDPEGFLYAESSVVSTSGTPLLDRDGLKALVSALPLLTLLIPNVPAVIAMTGKGVATESDLIEAGHPSMDLGARAVLLKGGHLDGDEPTDILLQKGISEPRYFSSRRTHTRNDHGTGCALATSWKTSFLSCPFASLTSSPSSPARSSESKAAEVKREANLAVGPHVEHMLRAREFRTWVD